jgi:hypothetical protein
VGLVQGSTEAAPRPPQRTPFIGVLNAAMRAARATGLTRQPVLEKPALLDQARAFTGLDDFGDPWFEQPFDALLDSLREEARLNPAGEWAAMKQFVKVLADRQWAERWFELHPEILSRPLPRPIVIVGPMRSGTTWLHRLLAADHRFSHLRAFETVSPVPRPDFVPGGSDFRVTLHRRIMRVARLANPRTLQIHPTGPYEAEEELGLLCNSMYGNKHESQWWVPSYSRWSEACDATPAYRQLARLLRLVAWSQQASSLKPWLLKTPQHMMDLPALMTVFPDARVIFTHRDPLAVVPSAASLAWNQTIIYSDHADPAAVGREWLRKIALMVERMQAARADIPSERQFDVHYDDLERDWRGTLGGVYRFLGLDLGPALPAMESYQRRCKVLKGNAHQYCLEQFGLTSGEVLDRLGGYVKAYGVSVERRSAIA